MLVYTTNKLTVISGNFKNNFNTYCTQKLSETLSNARNCGLCVYVSLLEKRRLNMLPTDKQFLHTICVYFQISFHTSSDGFFKNVAKEIVPEDYGGTGPSVESLHS